MHDDALLAVVHAERHGRARLVDALQPEQVRPIARPVAQLLGAHADVAQSLNAHLAFHLNTQFAD